MRTLLLAVACAFLALVLFDTSDVSAQKKKKKDEDAPTPRKEDVPKLLKMLKSSTAKDRALAADQLGRLGQIQLMYVKDAIDPLLELLKRDADSGVRRASAEALGKIAPDPEKTVPALSDALKDKNIEVGLAAVTALGRFGPEAKDAVPALREFNKTKGGDKKTAQVVNAAIKEITGKKKG